MTAEEVALTFAPMCRTLSNLHIRRIVHRDIDERNVLAATDGSLRLNDWGSVAVAGDDTRVIARARALNVPPEYRDQMRVERVNGQDVVRLKKWTTWQLEPTYDAWQVGRLMYVMLTGDVMLGTKELIQKPNLSFDDIFGQSREVAEVVRGLTEPEPGDRMKLRKAEEMLVSSFSQPSPAWPSIDRVRCSAGDEASDESFVGVAGRAAGGRVRGDTVPVPVVGAVAELAAVGVTVEELGDWWQVSTSPETTYRVRGVEKTVGTYRTGTVIEVGSQRYVLGH
jgi:serine/threonine protein kinase